MNLVDYEKVVMHMKDYRRGYQEYWSSTASKTSNGQSYYLWSFISYGLEDTPTDLNF